MRYKMIRKNESAAHRIAMRIANEAEEGCTNATTRAEAEIDALFGALTNEIERRLDLHDEIKHLSDMCSDLEHEADHCDAPYNTDLICAARKVLLEVYKITAGL